MNLEDQEIKHLTKVFRKIDEDLTGRISCKELILALDKSG